MVLGGVELFPVIISRVVLRAIRATTEELRDGAYNDRDVHPHSNFQPS